MQTVDFKTVVIGSGLAGLTAAFYSSKNGPVALITKSKLDTSNSFFAQGGIAAAIADDDLAELHVQDTITAGRGLCDEDAVRILVAEGKERVLELIDAGMSFDRINGELVMGLEGAHSRRRILHAGGDETGKMLTNFVLGKVKEQQNIIPFEHTTALKLLVNNGKIAGVQVLNYQSGKNIIFKTNAVILATGGLSRIYTRSTNPHTATGDGIALAWDAGAQIADLEFVQFHPSALYIPGEEAFLISEAVRGEGAWLLNDSGERFMQNIHPLAELAPRDVVAYNIYRQIQLSGKNFVHLSLKHLDRKKIKFRFKSIYKNLNEQGFDLTRDLIPVAPAAHYMIGGVRTNLHAETNVPGLFVCGETASTGAMGANRLASNSLLECLVFGKRASDSAEKVSRSQVEIPEAEPILLNPETENLFLKVQQKIAGQMSKNIGIVRNEYGLSEALEYFELINEDFKEVQNDYNRLKIRNHAAVCTLVARSALVRKETRGSHIRTDFPEENPAFEKHIIQQINREINFEAVRRE